MSINRKVRDTARAPKSWQRELSPMSKAAA